MHSTEEASERIKLRPTTETDLPFVLQVEQDPSNTPFVGQWSLDEHKSALTNPDIGHWIIESEAGQTPVGYVIAIGLSSGKHEINLKRIVASSKGKGIGRKALQMFHRMVFERFGTDRIWLIVRRNNNRAMKFYLDEGYNEIGAIIRNKNVMMALKLEGEPWNNTQEK